MPKSAHAALAAFEYFVITLRASLRGFVVACIPVHLAKYLSRVKGEVAFEA